MENITIRGARIHNLKNIDLSIPKNKLVVITGISGSGKSSLAFDLLFEEGKNQYLRSIGILSGLEQEDRFEQMDGIGPTVAVRQNTIRQSNPRSTVGSKTGILNQLALVYACDGKNVKTEEGYTEEGYTEEGDAEYKFETTKGHLSPGLFLYTTADGMCMQCQGRGSFYDIALERLVPEPTTSLREVYQRLKVTPGFLRLLENRLGKHFETSFWQLPEEVREEAVYGTFDNGKQSYCIERILKNAFEKGEDVEEVYVKTICPECHGERVSEDARNVVLFGKRIGELGQMTLVELRTFLTQIPDKELSQFGRNTLKNVSLQLAHLIEFRLGHLSLYREMSSLSGGEIQRVFLHMHLGSKLDSLIYIFDEPMAGLHPAEKQSMILAVKELRDIGNTVIVVEHDKEMISQADHIIEIGPGAGAEGGTVVYQGDYQGYIAAGAAGTLLSRYISGQIVMPERTGRKKEYLTTASKSTASYDDCLTLQHANIHYLKDITVKIPLHAMVGIAGLSGSGKSSLIEDTLLTRLASSFKYGQVEGLAGEEQISGYAKISQQPIGRSASSTPASYIGVWDKIRGLFAKQPEAIDKGMDAGYFSFHSKGACPDCGGSGYEKIFLTSDFSVDKICPTCHGNRYRKESLSVLYQRKTITDILAMSIRDACAFFKGHTGIEKPLQILEQMGMGYLTLGQPTSSLSGGEAQRVKLAKELGRQYGKPQGMQQGMQKGMRQRKQQERQHSGNMLYVLDEPTTGLSLYDTSLLLQLWDQLVANGNSVIVIEHNVEILKKCDYILELGPGGGEKGGQIIASGTPEQLRNNSDSITGRYL